MGFMDKTARIEAAEMRLSGARGNQSHKFTLLA
jgi:hypothetical protein